jgi:hypothetical protein
MVTGRGGGHVFMRIGLSYPPTCFIFSLTVLNECNVRCDLSPRLTGSGKTCAFLLPIVAHLGADKATFVRFAALQLIFFNGNWLSVYAHRASV